MMIQPIFDKLADLRLKGMYDGLKEQLESTKYLDLSFEDRLSFLVDLEYSRRENSRISRRLKAACLHQTACVEDVDFSSSRGISKTQVLELTQAEWVRQHLNLIIIGPTGAGKSYLACALGHAICRLNISVKYERTSRLLGALEMSRADGSYPKFLDAMAKTQLLILDDWLRDPLTLTQTRDILEILDDRFSKTSTLIATQVPVMNWHERLADPTLADALLDRLVHNAFRLEFKVKNDSQRKLRSPLNQGNP